jgi:glycerophosphoryl diester phosphodiesterase
MDDFRLFGHRGVAGHYPENTRVSIEAAIELNLKWIEVDVRHIDGELIVFHDRRLERLCNQIGTIDNLTAADLKKLRISGQPLLTLNELIDLMPEAMGVNLEIKGLDAAEALCHFLKEKIRKQKIKPEQLLLSSFDHEQLFTCKQLLPDIDRGLLIYGVRVSLAEQIEVIEPVSIHQSIDFLEKELVMQSHLLGKKLYVYTVNTEDDIEYVIKMGVDGVFSDYPERVINYLKRHS